MTRLKRSRYFVISFEDRPVLDLGAFLRGRAEMAPETRASAVSPVAEATHLLAAGELELLHRVPENRWTARSRLAADHGVSEQTLDDLVAKGLLISDADDPAAEHMRQREEAFASCPWHPYAAAYHLMVKNPWGLNKGERQVLDVVAMAAESQDAVDRFVAKHGKPPAPFHEVPGDGESLRLPLIEKEGGLYRVLKERKTVRAFDSGKSMRQEDLATLLYYVFGCHGHTTLSKGVVVLKKTSPSGGSLHPVEVYPLVLNVAGVATGLYHYRVRDHSLVRMRPLEAWEAEAMAVGMAAGHGFASDANVLLLMTARFNRNFWKYRHNVKTHSVVLKDAAHLCQTFYLVCTDLSLGAFYVAFDGPFIEEALGLDGIEEGAIGLAGCGLQRSEGLDQSLDFEPYTPGETEIE